MLLKKQSARHTINAIQFIVKTCTRIQTETILSSEKSSIGIVAYISGQRSCTLKCVFYCLNGRWFIFNCFYGSFTYKCVC